MMNENGKQKLHSFLFEKDTELVNLKLFPGTGRELSAESLGAAAADAMEAAMEAWCAGVPSDAPSTGMKPRPLMG